MSDIDEYDDENLDLEEIVEGNIDGALEENDTNLDIEAEEAADDPVNDGEENQQPTKPKRIVRNPQPKLNAERLKGPRGIHKLESLFEKVKFKGHGHEEEDLNTLMKNYEYWCHRLFPKLPFDECLLRIEQLGFKKPVQTHITKIRMNMLVDEDETMGPVMSDEEDNNVDGRMDVHNFNTDGLTTRNSHIDNTGEFDDLIPTVQPVTQLLKAPEQLSEEQLNQIRIKREKAMKIRAERLKLTQQKQGENVSVSQSFSLSTTNNTEMTSDPKEIMMQNNDFD